MHAVFSSGTFANICESVQCRVFVKNSPIVRLCWKTWGLTSRSMIMSIHLFISNPCQCRE
jgi:hypothetical protein